MLQRNRIPRKVQHRMTVKAIGGVSSRDVIGKFSSEIVVLMAIDTLIAEAIEAEIGLGDMTLYTAKVGMGAEQRETIFFM